MTSNGGGKVERAKWRRKLAPGVARSRRLRRKERYDAAERDAEEQLRKFKP